MTKNAFGVTIPPKARPMTAHEALADFIRDLPAHTIMTVIIDNLAVRSDFNPERLEQQANQIGQIAHERARR